ncbi:MAG: HAMP domain-containing histidine kinase [Saprospiraceae bacterium]|nr:HAMP domain-containing histidine kinase [Saprospiraceae bacterium]
MNKWWRDPIIWLMSVSMALLLYLIMVWLVNSFNREYFQVVKDGENLFTNAVRTLEDSLIENNFERQLVFVQDSNRMRRQLIFHGNDTSRMVAHVTRGDTDIGPRNHLSRWQRRLRERSNESFVGSVAIQLAIGRDSTMTSEINHDTLAGEVFQLLKSKIDHDLNTCNFAGSYELVKSGTSEVGLLRTKAFMDMFTGSFYYLRIQPIKGDVYRKIALQIIFAGFTLLITFGAFVFSYGTLQKQRHLTLLKNDLINNISHELKTPIATVKVALEALNNFKADEDALKRKEYLEISKGELDRLDMLVENILKSSVQQQVLSLHLERINLKELIENTLKTMQLQFDKEGAKIQFDPAPNGAYIMGDRLHLTSVLYNLLDNALKYSSGAPAIKMQLKKLKNQITLIVSDEGVGIPKIYLREIFGKFFRIPTGDVHNIKGYGLGLSFVADVVRKHRGTIEARSVSGEGSQFILKFPSADVTD